MQRQLSPPSDLQVRVSLGEGPDAESIVHLASLDDGTPPDGPVVLAEMDGEPVAALGIADGAVVADPLRVSQATLFLMRAHRLEVRAIGAIFGF
jgi:hypothetical protein